MHPWKHFCTITKHRLLVCKHCFKVGLYWRGLTHDLSKYSPTEFWIGAKYYQGTRSPNAAEREDIGYSKAWMHHKGRNRHHFEYWTDLDIRTGKYGPVEMPTVFLVEMVMDRMAASKTYLGKKYYDGASLDYFVKSKEQRNLHPETSRKLEKLLTMLNEKGEQETFRYIREVVLKRDTF